MMFFFRLRITLAWFLLVMGGTAIPAFGQPSSPTAEDPFGSITDEPRFKHANWGILFCDLKTGDVLFEKNADKLFVPASTTKLYSVAAALDALGANFRFVTPVYRRGDVDANGVLNGDLILVASGDPTLGGRTDSEGKIAFKNSDHTYASVNGSAELTDTDPLAGLRDVARHVAASGIREVQGEVIVDNRRFDETGSSGSGPSRAMPICINDNVLDFVITPGKPGERAQVRWRPESTVLRVDASVETIAAGESPYIRIDAPAKNQFVVRGKIPAERRPLVLHAELPDPPGFVRSALVEQLAGAGVRVTASPLGNNPTQQLPTRDAYSTMPQVAAITSPPFSEEAKLILKVSHNLHATMLPLLVASHHGKRTVEEGLRLQGEFLKRAGVDVESISFGGGAGGSRADYTTPRATVQLLRYMSTRPDFAAYQDGLPILGVDGTSAKHASADSPAKGRVQAKTGTLYWDNVMNDRSLMTSKALAGYLTAGSGRRIAFALFVNNVHLANSEETGKIGEVLGKCCEIAVKKW